MAFPCLIPLPHMTSYNPAQYPVVSRPSMKILQKKRWTLKRVLLLLLSGLSGYDFCNEFALGGGTKAGPVQIPATPSEGGFFASWRDKSLALLRKRAATTTRRPPPPPPTKVTDAYVTLEEQKPSRPPTPQHAEASQVYTNEKVRVEEERRGDGRVSEGGYEQQMGVGGGYAPRMGTYGQTYLGLVEVE